MLLFNITAVVLQDTVVVVEVVSGSTPLNHNEFQNKYARVFRLDVNNIICILTERITQ